MEQQNQATSITHFSTLQQLDKRSWNMPIINEDSLLITKNGGEDEEDGPGIDFNLPS